MFKCSIRQAGRIAAVHGPLFERPHGGHLGISQHGERNDIGDSEIGNSPLQRCATTAVQGLIEPLLTTVSVVTTRQEGRITDRYCTLFE